MTPEIIFNSYFHFKAFPKRERESPDRKERGRRDFVGEPRVPVWRPQIELQFDYRTTPIVNRSIASIALGHTGLVDRSIVLLDLASAAQSRLHLRHAISIWSDLINFFCWVLFLLWMSVELIHYPHVYSQGSVWKIGWLGYVKHFP